MRSDQSDVYEPYFEKLEQLLIESKKQKNPALWLYKNDARGLLFMIESLFRLHAAISPVTEVKKLHKFSKKFEDLLGEIDYYVVILALFSKNKSITKKELDYFRKNRDAFEKKLNKKLLEKDYYIPKIRSFKTLSGDFNSPGNISLLHKHIKSELAEGAAYFNRYRSGFTDMEEQVHELRRKLRWISIYAESLRGRVVLRKDIKRYSWEKEFINQNSKKSPYNSVPPKLPLKKHIFFTDKAFFALNSCIAQLGVIKDKGLQIEALAKCFKKTVKPKPLNAKSKVQKILGLKASEEKLLKEAHVLLHKFYQSYKIHTLLC
ncbi:MAG: hypothetical protein JNL60_04040 [Bacteroidia bacterium]|nr:hypothetical protein [Bacteroidia bacterium]